MAFMVAFRTILALGLVTQASAAFDCAKYVATCSGVTGYEAYSNCAASALANAMSCRSQHLDLAAQSGGNATHCPHAQPSATGPCASENLTAADIVQTAQAASAFSILVEALVKANLVDTLKGTGPFTVFAPDNEAFTKALTALKLTKTQLLDRKDLPDILKYHVLKGKLTAAELKTSSTMQPVPLQGKAVVIHKDGSGVVTFGGAKETGGPKVTGGAKVTGADIHCSNGVIHQIDQVMLPPADKTTTTQAPTKAPTSLTGGAVSSVAAVSFLSSVAMTILA